MRRFVSWQFQNTANVQKRRKISLKGEGVYGAYSAEYVLKGDHRKVYCVHVQDSKSDLIDNVIQLAKVKNIPVVFQSKMAMNKISKDKPHQGVIVDATAIQPVMMEPHGPEEYTHVPVLLACDELQDPQNFGAVLRTAHYLRCNGVVTSVKNSTGITAAVSKASSGACEVLAANNQLYISKSLPALLKAQRALGWRIVGTSIKPNAISSKSLKLDAPTILVVGNEHKGMRKEIETHCDTMVNIQGHGEPSKVDSLNVSVATGILLHQLLAISS